MRDGRMIVNDGSGMQCVGEEAVIGIVFSCKE